MLYTPWNEKHAETCIRWFGLARRRPIEVPMEKENQMEDIWNLIDSAFVSDFETKI